MCVVVAFEEEFLRATVVVYLIREQMWLERLDFKVEMAMLGNHKMITRAYGPFDECLGSDII